MLPTMRIFVSKGAVMKHFTAPPKIVIFMFNSVILEYQVKKTVVRCDNYNFLLGGQ